MWGEECRSAGVGVCREECGRSVNVEQVNVE